MIVSELVGQIRKDLLSGVRETRNRVAVAMDADDTAVVCTYEVSAISERSIVSAGLEDMFVWAVEPSTKTLTVSRGEDSTAGTVAQDTHLYVNSEFSPARVLNAVNHELNSLASAGLFAVATKELTSSSTAQTYNLDVTSIIDLLEVRVDVTGPENMWPEVRSATLLRDAETDDFASGYALRVDESLDSGRPLRVVYSKPFTALASLAQDVVAVSGIPASAIDILILGAQMRLMAGYESKRAQTAAQGDTRRASEVRPGAALGSASGLRQIRRDRLNEERADLLRKYPPRRR